MLTAGTVRLSDARAHTQSELGEPDGFPVVWNHGGLSSRDDAACANDGLAGIRLVTVDRPGIARSSRRRGRRVADWPADVRELVDQLSIATCGTAGLPGRVRCWQGDGDTFVPRKHAERPTAELPRGELHVVADAGHFLLVAHAVEVFGALRADAT
jgi:pimeloyl-ACP methyl ester carboxylesterase